MSRKTPVRLEVRNATPADVPGILALIGTVYGSLDNYTTGMVLGQINNYPDGQFVAVFEGVVVGYCASSRVDEEVALAPHDWGVDHRCRLRSRHDPTGDWLYGYEMAVSPAHRGLRIGKRLYEARRALVERLELKGIVFGGRMPNYRRAARRVDGPADYVEQVAAGKLRDPVIGFQLANGFTPIGILDDYLPADTASMGFAAHMVWRNPYVDPNEAQKFRVPRGIESVRLATCQFQARSVADFAAFVRNVEYFVEVAAGYRSDFIVFPELFTLSLLSFEKRALTPMEAIDRLTGHREPLVREMSRMALRYNINIVGGSHPTRTDDGEIRNVAHVCLRDGAIHAQEKIHPTPNEAYWWKIKGGDSVDVIQTDIGPVGVLICYDSEFPELARRLVDEGARIIFVPFCTDNRQGYMRVRYCSQARAVENQCFVVMAGNVGNLPGVDNMDVQYAQSCILTPCDFPFARDGIAAEASENIETLTIADVNLADLTWARAEGTVRNLTDRRFDLYRINWARAPRGGQKAQSGRATGTTRSRGRVNLACPSASEIVHSPGFSAAPFRNTRENEMSRFLLIGATMAAALATTAGPASAQDRWDWSAGDRDFRLVGPGVPRLFPELRRTSRGRAFVMRNFDFNRDGLVNRREAAAANRAFESVAGRERDRFDWDSRGDDRRAGRDDDRHGPGPERAGGWDRPAMRAYNFRQTPQGARMTMQEEVLFATDSAVLRPAAIERLRPLAGYLRANPGVRVAIDGHTDSRGTDAHNQDLSERRAQSVREALDEMGVTRARFRVAGHGEGSPVATNATAAGMRLNRRVEVTLLGRRASEF